MRGKSIFYVIIISGLLLTLYASWDILQTSKRTNQSLQDAKRVVAEMSEDTTDLAFKPTQGDTVGLLLIPTIEAELAIVEGTDPEELDRGVGHYKGSYFPDNQGQIVLSGHRDTVFKKMGDLVLGDVMQIQMPYGEYSYEIIDTKIVDAEDTSIITLQTEKEELILTTCYPFGYIGNAPQRYIIYAEPVPFREGT